MSMNFNDYKNQIKEYCDLNSVDFQKLFKSPKGGSLSYIYFQHRNENFDRSTATIGGEPMPLVLMITKQKDGSLLFEPTEYIKHYAIA